MRRGVRVEPRDYLAHADVPSAPPRDRWRAPPRRGGCRPPTSSLPPRGACAPA
jgi:hypothetical protein